MPLPILPIVMAAGLIFAVKRKKKSGARVWVFGDVTAPADQSLTDEQFQSIQDNLSMWPTPGDVAGRTALAGALLQRAAIEGANGHPLARDALLRHAIDVSNRA